MSGSSSSSPGAGAPEPAAPRAPDDAPLGLTVHSMPDARDAIDASQRQTRVGRLRMLLVMLVCAAPVIASYFTYYVVRPEGRRSQGELIEPQRLIPELRATAQGLTAVRFEVEKRAGSTLVGTLYNPSAANAQVRDATAGADCSSSAIATSVHSANITTTGNASTAVGNTLQFHWSVGDPTY